MLLKLNESTIINTTQITSLQEVERTDGQTCISIKMSDSDSFIIKVPGTFVEFCKALVKKEAISNSYIFTTI